MNFIISPEMSLLLRCARDPCPESAADGVRDASARCLDARRFARLCVYNKVAVPVLYHLEMTRAPNPGHFHHAVLPILRHRARVELRRQHRVSTLTASVAGVLCGAGVPHAFIRGQRLAARYYFHPAIRTSADVDVLVHADYLATALDSLQTAGLQPKHTGIEMEARARFKAQVVMRHPTLRVLLDVNWNLTGNSGIGRIDQDMDAVWERARLVTGSEWELSAEDTLFGLIRHVGHGHGFACSVLQCCIDVAAILRKEGHRMDWDLIGRLARESECSRVVRIFAHFFDKYYHDDTMPSLGDKLPRSGVQVGSIESRLYATFVIVPLLSCASARRGIASYVNGMLPHVGKLWALDRLKRLLRILAALIWPRPEALIIMTPYSKTRRLLLRRIQYYFVPFTVILPAVLLGTVIRLIAMPSGTATR